MKGMSQRQIPYAVLLLMTGQIVFAQDVTIKKNANSDPRIEIISLEGNTFIGDGSGQVNTGYENTSTGYRALYSNTSGYDNTANGYKALFLNTTGDFNTANGVYTLSSNTTGSDNTATGYDALRFNTTGNYNTANGAHTLSSNTEGFSNSANGWGALYSNTTGSDNTANGVSALFNNTTGISNTAVGRAALFTINSSTGWANTGVGFEVLRQSTISSGNTAIGYHAGGNYDNSYDNTFLGNQADANAAGYYSSTAVGATTTITASNQVRIGAAATSIGGPQNWTNTSDGRIKNNIREDVHGLDFITQLRPVTYTKSLQQEMDIIGVTTARELPADNTYEKIRYSGFIAQEVEQAANLTGYDFSGVDPPKNDKDLYGLRYAEFVVPLVKAVQELSLTNQELSARNDEQDLIIVSLKSQVANQNAENEKLTQRIEKLELLLGAQD